MSKYNLVNIILGVIAVILLVVCLVLRSTLTTVTVGKAGNDSASSTATVGKEVTNSASSTVDAAKEIYDSSLSTVSNTNLDSQEAQANNSMFESYFSSNASGIEVKQLISLVNSHNSTSSASKPSQILVKLNNQAISDSSSIDSSKKYNIQVSNENVDDSDPISNNSNDAGYYSSGFIRVITITENP